MLLLNVDALSCLFLECNAIFFFLLCACLFWWILLAIIIFWLKFSKKLGYGYRYQLSNWFWCVSSRDMYNWYASVMFYCINHASSSIWVNSTHSYQTSQNSLKWVIFESTKHDLFIEQVMQVMSCYRLIWMGHVKVERFDLLN